MSKTASHPPPPQTAPPPLGLALVVTLGLAGGIVPFATDLYLPAFPAMTEDLDTSAAAVQLSLTTFLLGIGVGQLVFGPLSDRVGRRIPFTVGMSVYLVASVAAAMAPTIEVLVATRLVQGLAGAAGLVIGRAVITDLARGADAARALSLAMLVGGISPIIAPVLGSVLTDPLGWRGLLWIVTGLVAAGLLAVLLFVRETNPRSVRVLTAHGPRRSHGRALLSRAYLGNMLAFSLSFAGMLAYIAASPFLFQTMIGLSEIQFGLVFGANALALMAVGALSARLTRRIAVRTLARWGLTLNLGACTVLMLLVVTGAPTVCLVVPISVSVASIGLIFGNTTALALAQVPGAAGLASAILGFCQHVFAGATAPLASIAGEHTAVPMAVLMLGCSAAARLAFSIARNHADGDRAAPVGSETGV